MNQAPALTLNAPRPEESPLAEASRLLDDGDAAGARRHAQAVLQAAIDRRDPLAEAHALSVLAHCDRLVSRLRRAYDASQRAVFLFRTHGEAQGEAVALATQCFVASSLGRNEDAVEAGLLSVRLSERFPNPALQSLALNNLGIAFAWARRFDKAFEIYTEASAIATRSATALSPFQPLMNMACAEAWRIVSERFLKKATLPTDDFIRLTDQALASARSDPPDALLAGMQVTMRTMMSLITVFARAWSGDPAGAAEELDVCREWADRYGAISWLHALERWGRGEVALAAGDHAGAAHEYAELVRIGSLVEHEQLACMGHMLRSHCLERLNQHDLAFHEMRLLRRREYQIRAESLESRERAAQWQIAARDQSRDLDELRLAAHRLERLALEDPLTGIANRRHLERRLRDVLEAGCELWHPTTLAFLDVDEFKRINDNFSHQVGDEVLLRVAKLMGRTIREHDFAARLAGDEFVVVLPSTDRNVAVQVVARLRSEIEGFDWSTIAAGLQVRVSAGVAEARPDDTVAELLDRSDYQMYLQKRAKAASPH